MLENMRVPWPLNCSKLPESNGNEQLCMAPQDGWAAPSGRPPVLTRPTSIQLPNTTPVLKSTARIPVSAPTTCPAKYHRYENLTCTNLCDPACKDCVPTCDDVLFTKQHKNFAYAWMAIWASLCIASTLFTIITFCIDPGRFRYPIRPVIFMAFCYFMYALAFFIPLFIPAREIICKSDVEDLTLMIVNGMESTLCVVIFLIQYYFGIAGHIWWLVLTLTWYLAASRKWGLEAINSIACYFHLFAWAVPAVLTIAILVTGRVDSNELTGMCYVGNHDKWPLLVYIIIPMCFLLLVGQIFLLAGFVSLLRFKTNLKTEVDNSNIRKLEKLMAKIGIFAILYTVPTVCVLGSHVHEFINLDAWRCMSAGDPVNLSTVASELTNSIPTVEIHMLKIFMSLIVGISICMWVLSAKTLKSCEKKFCNKNTNSRIIHNGQYRKQSSHTMTKSLNGNGYVQHYKFPSSRHHHHQHINAHQTHLTQADAVSL